MSTLKEIRRAVTRAYWSYLAIAALGLVVYGVAVPLLISSRDTAGVVLGFFLAAAGGWMFLFFALSFIKWEKSK